MAHISVYGVVLLFIYQEGYHDGVLPGFYVERAWAVLLGLRQLSSF